MKANAKMYPVRILVLTETRGNHRKHAERRALTNLARQGYRGELAVPCTCCGVRHE